MKKWLLLLLVLFLAALAACTPTIYGVPQPTWQTMSEAERIEAMRIYKQRQIAYQKAREERARQRAIERKKQLAREAKEARQRQKRIDAIYRGEGIYGDLLRVTLRQGRMRIGGKHRGYQPVSFRIANGERKKIDIYSAAGRRATLQVTYDDGTLVIDGHNRGNRSHARRLVYERAWGHGKTYRGIRSDGPLKLRDVATYIEIIGNRGRSRANEDTAQVIVIQQSPSRTHQPKSHRPPSRRQETSEGRHRGADLSQEVNAGGQSRRSAQSAASASAPQEQGQGNRSNVARRRATAEAQGDIPQKSTRAAKRIKVEFLDGTVAVRGKPHAFSPLSFHLKEGETRSVRIITAKGTKKATVGYQNGVLYLDGNPSNVRQRSAAAKIDFSSHWDTGRTYHINTRGKLNFKGLTVRIKKAD